MSGIDMSPAALVRKLAAHAPERVALIYEGTPVTFGQLADASARLAGVLASRGVRRGDRVAYLGLNSPAFYANHLATAWLGVVFVPINYRLTAHEVRQILVDSQAAAIVAEAGHREIAEAAAAELPLLRLLVDDDPNDPPAGPPATPAQLSVGPAGPAGPAWISLGAALAAAAPAGPPVACREEDPAFLVYTSGTTGKAKGVALSHGNLWWNHANLDGAAGMRCDDVNLIASPLFHTAPFGCFAARALLRGATSVLRRKIEASRVLADLVEHRVTTLFAVPAMLRAIAQLPAFATADLSRLAVAVTAGAPAPQPVLAAYLARGVALQQAYGLTEVLFATCVPVASVRATLGSVGVPLPLTEIRIAPEMDAGDGGDAGDSASRAGEVGEVWVRGPTVMAGYWQNPEATAAVMRPGGWFRTGDLGYLDPRGNLFVVDRKKDMIIVAGDNVYSGEVERILADHPAIAEVAVVGVEDATWGEAVVAAVVLHDGQPPPALPALRAFAAPHLAAYKLPMRLEVLTELPRNAMGKVNKPALREAFSAMAPAAASPSATTPPPASASTMPPSTAAPVPAPAPCAPDSAADPAAAAQAATWTQRLAAMPASRRQRTVFDLVQSAIADMVPHVPMATIDDDTRMLELGLGSLAAVELSNRLRGETGIVLATTLVFDYPTVGALARHLDAQLAPSRAADAADAAPPAPTPAAVLAAATDEDLFHLLDEQLRRS